MPRQKPPQFNYPRVYIPAKSRKCPNCGRFAVVKSMDMNFSISLSPFFTIDISCTTCKVYQPHYSSPLWRDEWVPLVTRLKWDH